MKATFLLILLVITQGARSQSISPDRGTKEMRVYSYEQDGVRHYASKPPTVGSYRAVAIQHIVQTSKFRINGLLCSTDCAAEARGFRNARDRGVKDYADCPREPQLEALGCSLWLLDNEQGRSK